MGERRAENRERGRSERGFRRLRRYCRYFQATYEPVQESGGALQVREKLGRSRAVTGVLGEIDGGANLAKRTAGDSEMAESCLAGSDAVSLRDIQHHRGSGAADLAGQRETFVNGERLREVAGALRGGPGDFVSDEVTE
jgi:hypothetical protein